jgi:hypothetical protein
LRVLPRDESEWHPVSVIATTEYRRLLGDEWIYDAYRNYWGFGAECTIYEVISLRAGV